MICKILNKFSIWLWHVTRQRAYKKMYGAEWNRLQIMIDKVSIKCKEKLKEKLDDGFHGWDDSGNIDELKENFFEHVEKGLGDKENLIDIVNLAAFIWNISEGKEDA